jgi:hypothetical protein
MTLSVLTFSLPCTYHGEEDMPGHVCATSMNPASASRGNTMQTHLGIWPVARPMEVRARSFFMIRFVASASVADGRARARRSSLQSAPPSLE